jgi:hypothetical protein
MMRLNSMEYNLKDGSLFIFVLDELIDDIP